MPSLSARGRRRTRLRCRASPSATPCGRSNARFPEPIALPLEKSLAPGPAPKVIGRLVDRRRRLGRWPDLWNIPSVHDVPDGLAVTGETSSPRHTTSRRTGALRTGPVPAASPSYIPSNGGHHLSRVFVLLFRRPEGDDILEPLSCAFPSALSRRLGDLNGTMQEPFPCVLQLIGSKHL